MMIKRWLVALLLALVVSISVGLTAMWPLSWPDQTATVVRPGQTMSALSHKWRREGLLNLPQRWLLVVLARFQGQIYPGQYLIPNTVNVWELSQLLNQQSAGHVRIQWVEGESLATIRERLQHNPLVENRLSALNSAQLAQHFKLNSSSLEGWLWPDTYVIAPGTSDEAIYQRALKAMERQLQQTWDKRAPGLPYANPYELLIAASLVEKETGRAEDRALIAAVWVNRLRLSMPLQSDPTVIYGLGASFDGNLTRDHLRSDTPFNTYTRRGLPPTPIAMPGRAALEASAHPAASEALYFVARGDGSSEFSSNLEQHNRAVNAYQRLKKP